MAPPGRLAKSSVAGAALAAGLLGCRAKTTDISGASDPSDRETIVSLSSDTAAMSPIPPGGTPTLTVTLSDPAELGYHDALGVQGTGCVDPATESGEGLLVGTLSTNPNARGALAFVRDPISFHRDDASFVGNQVEANNDGSFSGELVATDALAPGVISVSFVCARSSGQQPPVVIAETGYQRVTLRADLGGITFTPAFAHPGDTVAWRVDCGDQASPGYTNVHLVVLGQNIATVVSEGSHAVGAIEIPTEVTGSAVHDVSATCETQRIGTHRYPTGTLTVEVP